MCLSSTCTQSFIFCPLYQKAMNIKCVVQLILLCSFQVLGKKSDNEVQIQQVTNQKIQELDIMLKKNQSTAAEAVKSMLFQIEIQLHENVKL